MKLENLVVLSETAKAMKDAGWEQGESVFLWAVENGEMSLHFRPDYECDPPAGEEFAAPTFQEIIKILPAWRDEGDIRLYLRIISKNVIGFYSPDGNSALGEIKAEDDNNLAEAAGQMWLWLKKEGLNEREI